MGVAARASGSLQSRPTVAVDKELRAQINRATKLPDVFLLCRLVGHAWHRILPDRPPPFGRLIVWECVRCGSKRDDVVRDGDGMLLHRGYRYAEGYLLEKPVDRKERGGRMVTVPALRVALLQRDDVVDARASIEREG